MRRPVRPSFSAVAVSAAAVLTVGCYTYTPISSSAVPANQKTRVNLTEEGSFAVARFIGPYGNSLDGRITQTDDSGFVMAVSQVTRRTGVEESWRGEPVRVPRSAVASVSMPKLSRTRSALVAGGVIAVALGLATTLGGGSILGRNGGSTGSGQK